MEKIKTFVENKKIAIVMAASMLVRAVYVLATAVAENRQYDLGPTPPDMEVLGGHLGYIFNIYLNRQIPQVDPVTVYQYFHPPLHHIIEALWLGVCSIFTQDTLILIECLQIPTLVYSCLILVVAYMTIKELGLSEKVGLVVVTILGFQPSFIFMAGSINNDGLMFLFQFLIIYTSVRWYLNRTTKNILLIALSIGLGMITKLSAGLLSLPVAVMFLYVFVLDIKNKTYVKRLIQYAIFGIVCVPIGMAWEIRCYVKYAMPLNYAYELSKDSWQYVGDHSFAEIFLLPNPLTLLGNLSHGSIGMGENMWIQLFRTAALGECDLSEFSMLGKLICLLMIAIGLLVALAAFICMGLQKLAILKKKQESMSWQIMVFLLLCYGILLVFYISFIYNYPFECTMNFRYIVPTVFIPALFFGLQLEQAGKKINIAADTLLLIYAVTSIATVAVWCV